MLYEAELLLSSNALLSLEPFDASGLARLTTYFGFTTRLADQRRERLAAALAHVLDALQACGIDDAVFATRDGVPCFVDREGAPADLAEISTQVSEGPVDYEVLHLFARETFHEDAHHGAVDPYRGEGTNERHELELAVDVEFHRVIPFDGYPLRLRVHGLIKQLRARADEPWDELERRTASYIHTRFPTRSIHGHDDIPEEFHRRVERLSQALSLKFGAENLDSAQRSAIVVPRTPRQGSLEELPAPLGASSFATLPGLEDPLRYLFAWPQVHAGISYAQVLVLDGRGQRLLATGTTPVLATGAGQGSGDTPENTLAPGVPPLHLPVPDILAFSGHEWDAEARRELVIARGTSCEGLEGDAALIAHERRKFECGRRGPARPTSVRGGTGGSSAGSYPGELGF